VGGIVRDESERILLILRGHEPAKGLWSLPGGRVEPGESDAEATVREVHEETALEVEVRALAGVVERDTPDGARFVIRDYLCDPVPGTDLSDVHAGDDADDAGWFTPAEAASLDCSPGLLEALREWGVL
jgi:8-oxo-dGTP diphosphatase